jgi:hypothetical protein
MGAITQGQRFDTPDEVWESRQPGAYSLTTDDDGIRWLSFLLPTGDPATFTPRGRIPDQPADGLPGWTFNEHEDGSVTVSPSIDAVGVWHGFLVEGVWRSC